MAIDARLLQVKKRITRTCVGWVLVEEFSTMSVRVSPARVWVGCKWSVYRPAQGSTAHTQVDWIGGFSCH